MPYGNKAIFDGGPASNPTPIDVTWEMGFVGVKGKGLVTATTCTFPINRNDQARTVAINLAVAWNTQNPTFPFEAKPNGATVAWVPRRMGFTINGSSETIPEDNSRRNMGNTGIDVHNRS